MDSRENTAGCRIQWTPHGGGLATALKEALNEQLTITSDEDRAVLEEMH